MIGFKARMFQQNRCPFLRECPTGLVVEGRVFEDYATHMEEVTPVVGGLTVLPTWAPDKCEIEWITPCLVSYFEIVEVGGDERVVGATHVIMPREDKRKPAFTNYWTPNPNHPALRQEAEARKE